MSVRAERLVSLDVFRGMTVAGMLLVNNPGTWSAIYPPLQHAAWNGWTPTDLIFPFFLFIVGITTELSLRARRARGDDERAILRQMLRRGALIFLFGLLLSGFPFFTWPPALPDATLLERIADRFAHWRVFGVLQRIGIAYLFGALLTWRTTLRQQCAILAALLLGYWALMTLVPVPDTGIAGRPPRRLDARAFGPGQAGDRDVALHAHRQTVQCAPAVAGVPLGLQRTGLHHRIGRKMGERPIRRVQPCDGIERVGDQRRDAQPAIGQAVMQYWDRCEGGHGHCGWPRAGETSAASMPRTSH